MKYVRLKKRGEFGKVFTRGRTFGDRYLVLFVLRLDHNHHVGRVGFATQRNVGSAVKRNRIRRRLRALCSAFADDIITCGDLIILGKTPVLNASWNELLQSMKRVLRKAGCLEGKG